MQEIIAVMGGESEISSAACDKLVRLAKATERALRVYILAYRPSFSRFYLNEEAELSKAKKKYQESVSLLAESVAVELNDLGITAGIDVLWEVNSIETLQQLDSSDTDRWFAMLADQDLPTNLLREVVHGFRSPVLWLHNSEWPESIALSVAVDPMHEHDRPASTDNELVSMAKSIKRRLQARLSMVHSCNFPAYVEQYREKIGRLHQQALEELASKHHIDERDVVLLQGSPDTALAAFVAREQIDLLLIGSINRNALHRSLVGSTTEQLMQTAPCDLMFIKPHKTD